MEEVGRENQTPKGQEMGNQEQPAAKRQKWTGSQNDWGYIGIREDGGRAASPWAGDASQENPVTGRDRGRLEASVHFV